MYSAASAGLPTHGGVVYRGPMRTGRVALGILLALAAASAPARAETRTYLEGDLRLPAPYASMLPEAFWNATGEPVGTFAIEAAAPELDFRAAPGTLTLVRPGGTLTAVAPDPPTLFGVLPRDPDSGRPLTIGSEGGSCPTTEEPECWVLGDAIPEDTRVHQALVPPGESGPVLVVPPFPTSSLEMAALSWNLRATLLAFSQGIPVIPFEPPAVIELPQCSLATPQYCESVAAFLGYSTMLLPDDPLAPPSARFVWQAGAEYAVTEATGDLAAYAGGSVHVLGLERSRNAAAGLGLPILLFPASGTLALETPFAYATASAPTAPTFGVAYATAPEPADAALGACVVACLAALRARARRRA